MVLIIIHKNLIIALKCVQILNNKVINYIQQYAKYLILKTQDISMKKKLFSKNKGILFWITRLFGSDKTILANLISKFVNKKYGSTLVISGDEPRDILNFTKFDKKSRLKYPLAYPKFCKILTENQINVIFSTVSLFHQVRG
jgi:adenylylsulfate kinase-like enzyme|tara:strand:+ start:80 stop:505 length:426 start_codon:yes stop_codon:yes gene_type:complete